LPQRKDDSKRRDQAAIIAEGRARGVGLAETCRDVVIGLHGEGQALQARGRRTASASVDAARGRAPCSM
jgi:hypothetical protein